MNFKKWQDNEAYVFALCFLMPEKNFEIVANKHTTNGICDVEKVAEEFGVEKDKAYQRGGMLGLWKKY